ncbi:hypothetical protein AMELA_G00026290 [Ameiurus melas]|uniref:Uncharacterized protein n=1 Tax=Ameiurus melas TaxID=219545 RepID=A0A7J6BE87_AMEME|nr:hypothetical protein AMELA_G00026290 [Ameiurus melas]
MEADSIRTILFSWRGSDWTLRRGCDPRLHMHWRYGRNWRRNEEGRLDEDWRRDRELRLSRLCCGVSVCLPLLSHMRIMFVEKGSSIGRPNNISEHFIQIVLYSTFSKFLKK